MINKQRGKKKSKEGRKKVLTKRLTKKQQTDCLLFFICISTYSVTIDITGRLVDLLRQWIAHCVGLESFRHLQLNFRIPSLINPVYQELLAY